MKKPLLLMLAVVAGAMTAGAQVAADATDDSIVLLEYIKSTGQQAFNTGYIHKASTQVALDCEVTKDHSSNWEALFGARLTSFHNNALCFFSRANGNDVPCYNRSGVETMGSGFVYGEHIAVISMGNQALWVKESDPENIAGSVTTTGTVDDGKTPMLLFNLNTSSTPGGVKIDTSPCVMTCYEFVIMEDNKKVHDFKPAIVNGVVGLYDWKTGDFGGSITGTPFVAGPQKKTYFPLLVESNAGGVVDTGVHCCEEGGWATFVITREPDYFVKKIEVKDKNGNNIEVTPIQEVGLESIYYFQMPARTTTVYVEFQQFPYGDVNGDTQVTIADFVAVLNAMAGEEVNGNADVNNDGDLTIADGVAVLNAMAGGGSSSAGGDDGGDIINGDDDNPGDEIYDVAEVQPEFPGGTTAMLQWIQQNMRYPQSALDEGIQGRVFVQFIVEKDGSLTDIKVLRSIDTALSNEALRLVRAMPKWTPAKINGQPVRFRFTMPITFRLPE